MIVIGGNTLDNGQSCFTEDIHASLKTSRSFWNSDRIGRSLSDLPKTKYNTKVYVWVMLQFVEDKSEPP